MTFISDDRFPDVPMSTQGTNPWHDESLGDTIDSQEGIPGGQNLLTVDPAGGFQWQRGRPSGSGTFHRTEGPSGTSGAGYTVGG